jgi:hypothetical protein
MPSASHGSCVGRLGMIPCALRPAPCASVQSEGGRARTFPRRFSLYLSFHLAPFCPLATLAGAPGAQSHIRRSYRLHHFICVAVSCGLSMRVGFRTERNGSTLI